MSPEERFPNLTLVGPRTSGYRPDSRELQLGLLSLAAVLVPRGLVPQIVDLNLLADAGPFSRDAFEQATANILETAPDIVGFGTICNSYPLTMRLAAEVKRRKPAVTVILGGPQASASDRETMLAFPFVDFILRGEAEETLPQLLEALPDPARRNRVPGLTYRWNRRVERNPNAPVIADLDSLPLPLYDFYPDVNISGTLPLEAGRGCPFACRFCSTNDFFRRKFRLKSAEVLVGQMRELSHCYGILDFQLTHDMFTVDRKRVEAFCHALLAQDRRFTWRCSARTDCVDRDLLALMQRAGCVGIFFGIETGSQRLQHEVEKNLHIPSALATLETADRIGLHSTASLITGYPGEALSDLDGTVDFFAQALRLDRCEPQLHLLAPLAATPLAVAHRDELAYTKLPSDVSGEDTLNAVDELLVLAHPEVFPNFYALPCPVDRNYLHGLRAFLLSLAARAKNLAFALHRECGGLRSVFENWRIAGISGDFRSREPFRNFLSFVQKQYRQEGYVAVPVLASYYRGLSEQPSSASRIAIASGKRIITVEGDVLGILHALRNELPLEPTLARGPRTYAVDVSTENSQILELSPLSAKVIRWCMGDLGTCPLDQANLPRALDLLWRQGLIERTEVSARMPANSEAARLRGDLTFA